MLYTKGNKLSSDWSISADIKRSRFILKFADKPTSLYKVAFKYWLNSIMLLIDTACDCPAP